MRETGDPTAPLALNCREIRGTLGIPIPREEAAQVSDIACLGQSRRCTNNSRRSRTLTPWRFLQISMLTSYQIIEDSPDSRNGAERLADELKSEVPPKHALYGLKARAVATRIDRDDVVFEIEGGRVPLAVVHMTWRKETDPLLAKDETLRELGAMGSR